MWSSLLEVSGVGVVNRRFVHGLLGGGALVAALIGTATVARADVVTPPGQCVASGVWQSNGRSEASTDHVSSDVIVIPRSDVVAWKANITGYEAGATGPRRPIEGEVKIDMPLGSISIDSWGGDSERYANEGQRSYDLPIVLYGVEFTLHGEHRENGAAFCSGSVHVRVEGSVWSNPVTYGGLGLAVVSVGMLFLAGRPVLARMPSPGS